MSWTCRRRAGGRRVGWRRRNGARRRRRTRRSWLTTDVRTTWLGETDPLNGPAVVEAMTSPPSDVAMEGGAAALPEIAMADRPSAAETQDAIVALTIEAPRPEEQAQQAEQGTQTPMTTVTKAQN